MKCNKFSQNFTVYYGILLRFHSTLIYFINFWFCFRSFQKFTTRFWSLLKWFEILDLAMAKFEKVDIVFTQP